MKALIRLLMILHPLLGLCQSKTLMNEFKPMKFKENIRLQGYEINETYKINNKTFILIGKPEKYNSKDEGLRIIYLAEEKGRYKIHFVSKGVGESYIYTPTFFQGNGRTIIVCEMGTEYSWGMDAFLLQDSMFIKLGNIDVAANINEEEHQESAVPILRIEDLKESIEFKFSEEKMYQGVKVNSISLFYKPGQRSEEILSVKEISYKWSGTWERIKIEQ